MSDNLSDELIARGLKSVNRSTTSTTPASRWAADQEDRLWFYGSFREWGNERQAANKFYNATQHTPFYTPTSAGRRSPRSGTSPRRCV
jgi:hypothetical protein